MRPMHVGIEKRNLVSVESPSHELPECSDTAHAHRQRAGTALGTGTPQGTGPCERGALGLGHQAVHHASPGCWRKAEGTKQASQGETWDRRTHFLLLISINTKQEKVKARILAAVSLCFMRLQLSQEAKIKPNSTEQRRTETLGTGNRQCSTRIRGLKEEENRGKNSQERTGNTSPEQQRQH